jgi:flagellar hook-basal body complex protein FliE
MSDLKAADAISAYNRVNSFSDKKYDDAEGNGGDFTSMVESAIGSSFDKVKKAEQATEGLVTGEVSTEELAIAVANAEVALNTLIAIRDRAVSAFQDIIRMPI